MSGDQKLVYTDGQCHIETETGELFARAYSPEDARAIVARWNALRLHKVEDAEAVGRTAFPALVRLHNTITELTRERDELRAKLRDEFAAAALQALLPAFARGELAPKDESRNVREELVAEQSYHFADAMIEARKA